MFLMKLGLISEPLQIMNTTTAVYIGIVYSYLPFMILPLYASLEKINPALLEAAEDLGSRPWRAFWRVTFPLSLPGVFAGCLLVFIPAVGEFVIPDLLGGSEHADDRQDAVDRVLQQPRLASGFGGRRAAVGCAHRSDRPLPASAAT